MKLRRALAALALFVLAAAPALAEHVARFDVDVFLSASDRFTVEERIAYDFGAEQRHGIERFIPIHYGRGYAADYRIALELESVTDANGAALQVSEYRDGPNLVLRIGDPDTTVSGVREYRIRYSVRRGFLWLPQHDELYWNVTGSEWPVPIERVSARELGHMLLAAFRSPVMPEFIASMPLVGVDGTMYRRLTNSGVAGQAHIKTGLLSGVRALAGFVLDAKGRRVVTVMLINHANAHNANAVQDALLRWVHGR